MAAEERMGLGVEVVKREIEREFGPAAIQAHHDPGRFATVLGFRSGSVAYFVLVSDEFDQDYGSGRAANVDQLGSRLRTAGNHSVRVTTVGVLET